MIYRTSCETNKQITLPDTLLQIQCLHSLAITLILTIFTKYYIGKHADSYNTPKIYALFVGYFMFSGVCLFCLLLFFPCVLSK